MPFQCAFYSSFSTGGKKRVKFTIHKGIIFAKIIIILSEIFTEIGSAYHWQWRLIIYIDGVYVYGI